VLANGDSVSTAASALAKLADELGDLELELAPLKAKFARLDAIKLAIRGAYKTASAGDAYQVDGKRWTVLVGVCGNQTVVDVLALFKLVGAKVFLSIAGVSLKAIQENCAAEVLGAVVSTRLSGSRQLTTIPVKPAKPLSQNRKTKNWKTPNAVLNYD
jgi:hypothetical protein